jgi:hypothetical protein
VVSRLLDERKVPRLSGVVKSTPVGLGVLLRGMLARSGPHLVASNLRSERILRNAKPRLRPESWDGRSASEAAQKTLT